MEKEYIANYKKWNFIVPAVCFLVLSYFVVTNQIAFIDQAVYDVIAGFINPVMTNIMIAITYIGTAWVMIPISILLLCYQYHQKGYRFFLNLAFIWCLNEGVKLFFTRERPNILRLVSVTGYSYPSGHSMVSFAFYGFLILTLLRSDYKYKKVLSIFLSFIIVSIGISRIYLGVHYFSDVVGGFLFSYSYLLLLKNISSK